jgi:hypothetical protein
LSKRGLAYLLPEFYTQISSKKLGIKLPQLAGRFDVCDKSGIYFSKIPSVGKYEGSKCLPAFGHPSLPASSLFILNGPFSLSDAGTGWVLHRKLDVLCQDLRLHFRSWKANGHSGFRPD